MIDHATALLANNELFGELPETDRQRIIERCTSRKVTARQVIFHQGDMGREMFIVLTGRLKVSVTSQDGKELSFFIFQAGDIFGELALLDGERRSATVTAISPSNLLVLHHRDFRDLLKEQQLIGLKLLSVLAGRLRATTSLYENSVFVEIPGRLAGKLMELAEEHGDETEEGIQIEVKLSQYELGTLINASRESVNKQLKVWQGQGLIEMRQGKIFISEPEVLEALHWGDD